MYLKALRMQVLKMGSAKKAAGFQTPRGAEQDALLKQAPSLRGTWQGPRGSCEEPLQMLYGIPGVPGKSLQVPRVSTL